MSNYYQCPYCGTTSESFFSTCPGCGKYFTGTKDGYRIATPGQKVFWSFIGVPILCYILLFFIIGRFFRSETFVIIWGFIWLCIWLVLLIPCIKNWIKLKNHRKRKIILSIFIAMYVIGQIIQYPKLVMIAINDIYKKEDELIHENYHKTPVISPYMKDLSRIWGRSFYRRSQRKILAAPHFWKWD